MSDNTPIYTFKPYVPSVVYLLIGRPGLFILGALWVSFLCIIALSNFPDDMEVIVRILVGVQLIFWLFVPIQIVRKCIIQEIKKAKNTSFVCYEDRIEYIRDKKKETFLKTDMLFLEFQYAFGLKNKKIGHLYIEAKETPDEEYHEEGNVYILENLPNIEDAHFKVKHLYNLPDRKEYFAKINSSSSDQ